MAENKVSMRTPLARVKGLGAAGHGVEHWWLQRVTAIANIPLVIAFVVIVAVLWGSSYQEAIALISHPLVAIVLSLAVISVCLHMRLGMQVVIEDYLHGPGSRLVALLANNFYAAIIAAACLFAILKVSLGRILV